MKVANDGFRFVLELAVLIALAYWAYRSTPTPLRWPLMFAAPVAVGTVWARWVASNSSTALNDPWRFLLEVAAFGAGVAAFAVAGRTGFAIALAALSLTHLALIFALDQRSTRSANPTGLEIVTPRHGSEAQ